MKQRLEESLKARQRRLFHGVNVQDSLQPCGVTSRLRLPMSVVDNTPRGKATGVSTWYGVYPVPQNAPHVSAGMNVVKFPEGQRPKATDVSTWYGVYLKQWILPIYHDRKGGPGRFLSALP